MADFNQAIKVAEDATDLGFKLVEQAKQAAGDAEVLGAMWRSAEEDKKQLRERLSRVCAAAEAAVRKDEGYESYVGSAVAHARAALDATK